MSHQSKGSSSSHSVPARLRPRRRRGIPSFCRCGEAEVIKTSGTAKNPGRLFYCCPYGSEEDKNHLFTWTDERIVEEVEDLKVLVCDLNEDISELRSDVAGLGKQLQPKKLTYELADNGNRCCVIL